MQLTLVIPEEWDIKVKCDGESKKCRIVYVERLSRQTVERLGIDFERLVENTRRLVDTVMRLYAVSGIENCKIHVGVEGDKFVGRLEGELPPEVVATMIVGEFLQFSFFARVSVADLLLSSVFALADVAGAAARGGGGERSGSGGGEDRPRGVV